MQVEVLDETDSFVEGARVYMVLPSGEEITATYAGSGVYEFIDVAPGRYTGRIEATDFATYEDAAVELVDGDDRRVTVVLRVAGPATSIFVSSALPPSTTPEFIGGARVLRGRALDSLPNSASALQAYLRLLAPRSNGPFGPTILIDGFQGGNLPPKASIREIRINDNPFAAEYSDVGLSRVEILTRPGTETWQSSVFLNFNDESMNSRNTFAPVRAPFQNRIFGVNTTGPITTDQLGISVDAQRVELDDNALINATIVDPSFEIRPLNRTVVKPSRGTNGSLTLNYQSSENNTLVAKYLLDDGRSSLEGVGEFSLETRAFDSDRRTHTVQLTDTAVVSESTINETRFQYIGTREREEGDSSVPTIEVPEAFSSGGSPVGLSVEHSDAVTASNHTTWTRGNHSLKGGVELRVALEDIRSSENLAGTYVFTGRIAPRLDSDDVPVLGPGGGFILEPITNIESYRRTIRFQSEGRSVSEVRALGGGATLFSISDAGSETSTRQYEGAGFFQHDWRARTNLSLNLGLRVETQNNIGSRADFAPRFGVAWEPLSGTVIRAGSGVFYRRVSEDLVLQSRLLNGTLKRQFVTGDPDVLARFPDPLSVDLLSESLGPQTVWRLAEDIRSPYEVHSSVSIERFLPLNSTIAVTLTHTRGVHALRSRNVNAPFQGSRPFPDRGEIFQFESSGVIDQRQMIVNTTHNLNDSNVLWTTYTLGDSKGDTDGPFDFPADSYDLGSEYGASSSDARHTVYAGGWFRLPGGIELTPLVMWRSGLPFNVTTGRDTNGDSQFNERPAFATDATRPSVVGTPLGLLDLEPVAGQAIVGRNFARGPDFTVVNLQVMKLFQLSSAEVAPDGRVASGPKVLALSVQLQNVFNQTNLGTPVGNLSSQLFGQSNFAAGDFGFGSNSAGTRRIEASVFFSF